MFVLTKRLRYDGFTSTGKINQPSTKQYRMFEGNIFIKDAKVGREKTLLDVSALYAIFSKLTLV